MDDKKDRGNIKKERTGKKYLLSDRVQRHQLQERIQTRNKI